MLSGLRDSSRFLRQPRIHPFEESEPSVVEAVVVEVVVAEAAFEIQVPMPLGEELVDEAVTKVPYSIVNEGLETDNT